MNYHNRLHVGRGFSHDVINKHFKKLSQNRHRLLFTKKHLKAILLLNHENV